LSKRLLPVVVALAVALAPLGAQKRQVPLGAPPPRQLSAPAPFERAVPFQVGEQLSYQITWSSFITATAATATFSIREKRPAYGSLAYYIVAEGRPTPVLAIFYSLYYKADTWLDARTLLPLRASVFSQERGRRENKTTLFDQTHGTARYEVEATTRSGAPGIEARTLELPPRTQDPLSAVFAIRALEMTAGTRTLMPMTFNGALYQVQVTIDGRESLKTPMGRLPAWRITPVMLERGRPVASPRGMTLWMSDDARRLPLKMEVELPSGRFNLTLSGLGPRR
jgi:hypothetical protein